MEVLPPVHLEGSWFQEPPLGTVRFLVLRGGQEEQATDAIIRVDCGGN